MQTYKYLGKIPTQDIVALMGNDVPDNVKFALECLQPGKRLTQAQAKLIDDWVDEQKKAAQAAPPVPSVPDLKAKNDEFNRKVQEDIQDQSKRIEQYNAAVTRLQQYEQEQGLQNTPSNHQAIKKFLDEAPELAEWRSKGKMLSPGIIDITIKWLRPTLQWKPAEPVTPAAPEAPVVEVVKLSDGTDQLALGTAPSYKHSKVQLADLARREAQSKSGNREGFHGVRF